MFDLRRLGQHDRIEQLPSGAKGYVLGREVVVLSCEGMGDVTAALSHLVQIGYRERADSPVTMPGLPAIGLVTLYHLEWPGDLKLAPQRLWRDAQLIEEPKDPPTGAFRAARNNFPQDGAAAQME